MNSEQKTWSLVTLICCASLVAIFAIMSDCSKRVAEVDGPAKVACLQGGGQWFEVGDPGVIGQGHCEKAGK